ncbi:MAG: F0F1 ATP synthase subunit A [Alphaproteobacteria bacterium]|nr:F0F1 ATP synthase subunit A [Alphaproteobacteria bacterium]
MENPLEQFVVRPLIHLNAGGYDLSFTQSSLIMMIGIALITAMMVLSMRPKALVPGRWQSLTETLHDFIFGMVSENLGEETRKFFPFVFSIFVLVLMGNLLGLVPYSFAYTSHISVTAALALFVFFVSIAVGFAYHGLHFFSTFVPPGLPFLMKIVIVPIEVVSFLSRPFSLAVRLAANMTAGHTMLKIFGGFCISLGIILGVFPMLVNVALLGLELLVAFIQAYVFAVLTCLYIKFSIELH